VYICKRNNERDMMTDKKKKKAGPKKKDPADIKKQICIYIEQKYIDRHGGVEEAQKLAYNYLSR